MKREMLVLANKVLEPTMYISGAATVATAFTTLGLGGFQQEKATSDSASIFMISFALAIGTSFLKDVIDAKIEQIEKNNYDTGSN